MNCQFPKMLGVLALVGCLAGGAQPSNPDLTQQLATVDFERLLKCHSACTKLQGLESEIQELVLQRGAIIHQAQEKPRDRVLQFLREAKEEMEARQAACNQELAELARTEKARADAEMVAIKARLDEELHRLLAHYDRVYWENLHLMAACNLASYKLEREKRLQTELKSERARLDSLLTADEDLAGARYQEEKLNLNLKLQNNPSADEERAIRQRLNAIDDEMAAAKAEKRRVSEAAMANFQGHKRAEFERDICAHEGRLREEVQVKAAPPGVREEIQQAQQTLLLAAEVRRQRVAERIKQREREIRIDMRPEQTEMQRRMARLVEGNNYLDARTRARLAQLDGKIALARSQHTALREKMRAGISRVVGQVAEQKHIPCVIGTYRLNLKLDDLTDFSLVGVSQLRL